MLVAGFPMDVPDFEYYLNEPDEPSRTRCIDNNVTCRSKCIGYCAYKAHPGYLTKKLRDLHNCIEKECSYFYKLCTSNDIAKVKINASALYTSNNDSKILLKAINITKHYEGMRVVKALRSDDGLWCLYYVSIAKYDFNQISKIIEDRLGIKIKMIRMNLSFDESAEIVLGKD